MQGVLSESLFTVSHLKKKTLKSTMHCFKMCSSLVIFILLLYITVLDMNVPFFFLFLLHNFISKKYFCDCRSRKEYVDLLVADLCSYYSYEKFLMQKFFELFPLNEVIIGLHLLH